MDFNDRYGIPAFSGFSFLGADLQQLSKASSSPYSLASQKDSSKVYARPESNISSKSRDEKKVQSHMIYALFVTSCCFFPIGLASIFSSKRCIRTFGDGDYKLARNLSTQTLHLAHVSLVTGTLLLIVFAATFVLYLITVQNPVGLLNFVKQLFRL